MSFIDLLWFKFWQIMLAKGEHIKHIRISNRTTGWVTRSLMRVGDDTEKVVIIGDAFTRL